MFRTFDAWRENRRNIATYRQLSHLSVNLLSDIGLTRDDLENMRHGRTAGRGNSASR